MDENATSARSTREVSDRSPTGRPWGSRKSRVDLSSDRAKQAQPHGIRATGAISRSLQKLEEDEMHERAGHALQASNTLHCRYSISVALVAILDYARGAPQANSMPEQIGS